jgi:peroxiredoxin
LGYQIVAVSPDNYQNLVSLEEKIEARYEIYSDENGELIKKIGIAFNSGEKRGILPVPTVMVLNQEGIILFEYINPNYRVRITPELLIAVLETVI